ncbi:MAG: radical SAM protein [Elusimicrobia bacterium]|nr:radical SAM protein [Elusimicrobiota bacterium]
MQESPRAEAAPLPTRPRPERVQFQWQIQYACNYRCPYCVFEGQWESVLKLDRKDIKMEAWVEVWTRMHRTYGPGDIFITGGEPSYYRGFVDLLKALTEMHYVSFDTNLSWSWEDLRRFVKEVGKRYIRLDTSFHSHSVDVREFIAKASFIKDNGINYVCRLVAWPPLLSKVEAFREEFAKAGLTFVVYPFNGVYEGRDYPAAYTDAERALIQGRTHELKGDMRNGEQADFVGHMINMHREPPAGRLCRSGFIYARVLPDGTVYRCQPYESRWMEPLGNIFDEAFALREEPTLCRSQWCEFEYRYLVDQG